MTTLVEVAEQLAGPRRVTRGASLLLLLLFGVGLALAQAPPAPARGRAEVAVWADPTDPTMLDQLSLRLVDNTDKQLLTGLAAALGQRFQCAPTAETFKTGDGEIITDRGIGLECQMRIVPRGQRGALPLAPFIEVLAPYAAQLNLVYVIQGRYQCTGFLPYRHPQVTLTAEQPTATPPGSPMPFAFYGMRAAIKTPNLSADISTVPRTETPGHRLLRLLALLLVAGLLGVSAGLLLARRLARWKATITDTAREEKL